MSLKESSTSLIPALSTDIENGLEDMGGGVAGGGRRNWDKVREWH